MTQPTNRFPKLHNAMWPGLVGKGFDVGMEPPISLKEMLEMTAAAEVNGQRFDGVDLFLADPHISIHSSRDDLKFWADHIGGLGLVVGSCVAPIWPDTGGGSAMGNDSERAAYLRMVREGCRIASMFREEGVRPYGVVRIDTACSPADWSTDKEAADKIVKTLKQAAEIAADHGERLALEGEICWGGIQSWVEASWLLEQIGLPDIVGFQADMAHTMLYAMGYNAPDHRLISSEEARDPEKLNRALATIAGELRSRTIDFHVAQNDGTVKGSGAHDKTGRHCLPEDPDGLLDIPKHAGHWLRDSQGNLTRTMRHVCWDGCMFSNETLRNQDTWNAVLKALISVRDEHGWQEAPG